MNVEIFGILNITPDSFSDGGKFFDAEKAINHAKQLIADGADVLDIGGCSTGPGSKQISIQEEISRLEPVVKDLANLTKLSIDTYQSKVADLCLSLGASIINDISAMRADPEMLAVIKAHNARVVLMYSKEDGKSPHISESKKEYINLVDEIKTFLSNKIEFALKSGILEDKIILDPGMGQFLSSNANYSWELLSKLSELTQTFKNFPMLIGTSRKGFLGGELVNRDPVSQLTALNAVTKGVRYVRTHNVKMFKEFLGVWERILYHGID
ncbi:MAG: dihydropteroate synthase, partial [Bdellovibrionales bacterium]|nr:dihydropteroate synthase [Bdellovibrionales bacterium]